jgi:sterol 3beta-glucosyltransferase
MQLKMLNRLATVKDDGTVVVDVPTDLQPATTGVRTEDGYGEVTIEESFDGTDIPSRPPMQIVILIVGTRGDVQPFVAIGKRLQVSERGQPGACSSCLRRVWSGVPGIFS